MERGECPYPRWRRESLSVGGVECPYPKREGEYPYPKREGGCLTIWGKRGNCLAPHMEWEGPKFT